MEKKQYKTAARVQLISYLSAHAVQNPRSADEIYQALAAGTQGAPGRSTVYRLLTAAVEQGCVKRYRAPAPASGYLYEYIGKTHHCEGHFHLHCLQCGNVWHLECGCGSEIAEHLRAAHGFITDRGRSVLYGICAECAAKAKGGATV